MITFENIKFNAQGEDKKAKVFPLSLTGSEDVTIKGCEFANKGYSSILMKSTGNVIIEDCDFHTADVYNPIEGGSGANDPQLTNVIIRNNRFDGICGNNYMNFYALADGAQIRIENNKISGMSQQAECIRVSNVANHNAKFVIKDLDYTYDMTTDYNENWTKMILAQDYTDGAIQDFSKFEFEIEGVKCNGQEVADAESFPVGGLICVFDSYMSADGESKFPTNNDPVITFNGVKYSRPVVSEEE